MILRLLLEAAVDVPDLRLGFENDLPVQLYLNQRTIGNNLNLMIDTSLQANQYRLLAEYLESFCRILPRHANAGDFLYQAALRTGNEDEPDKR